MILPDSDLHSEVYKLVKAAVDKKNRLEEENINENNSRKVQSSSTNICPPANANANANANAIYDVYMCVDEMEIEDEGISETGNMRDLVYEELVKQENTAILCYTELSYIAYGISYCEYGKHSFLEKMMNMVLISIRRTVMQRGIMIASVMLMDMGMRKGMMMMMMMTIFIIIVVDLKNL